MRRDMLKAFSPDAVHIGGFPLITFDRKPLDATSINAFVLEWTNDLTLVQFMDGDLYCLDGYGIYESKTLKRYRETAKTEVLARGALKRRLRPSFPKGVSTESWQKACETAASQFPLLVVNRERIKRDSCCIGRLVKTTRQSATLRA